MQTFYNFYLNPYNHDKFPRMSHSHRFCEILMYKIKIIQKLKSIWEASVELTIKFFFVNTNPLQTTSICRH